MPRHRTADVIRAVPPRVLIVSHPAVLTVNQLPYAALADRGWEPWVVVPARWRHEYAAGDIVPEELADLEGRIVRRRVALPGSVQRHVYEPRVTDVIRRVRPYVAFVEAEPTALPAMQWGLALKRAGVPFGLQADENLPRPYPAVARLIRRWTTHHAAFVAARSPTAARLIRERAPALPTPLIPHHVPGWDIFPSGRSAGEPFTVGFAGRLIPEKGLRTLADAVAGMPRTRLRLVGDGSMRPELSARQARGEAIEIVTGAQHGGMAAMYAGLDVLVLPSLTTPTWVEQFGRVLVEALSCRVPVVGSSSGEIPWVIEFTGGGVVFPEGDVASLRATLERLRDNPDLRARLAAAGQTVVRERFSVRRVADDLDAALRAAREAAPVVATP